MKKNLLILLMILVSQNGWTLDGDSIRPIAVDLSNYSFIDLKYSDLQIPSQDSIRFKKFNQRVNEVIEKKNGQVNVLHIGGSHIQADMFSHRVRQNLDAINGAFESPRGFIFPFSVAKTNNPANYKVSYSGEWNAARNVQKNREVSLGVGGITVYTNDSTARILVDLNPNDEKKRWTFDRLRVLGYPEEEGDSIRPVLYYGEEIIDSYFDLITETYVFELPELASSFEIGFVSESEETSTFFVNGFIPEKEAPGIVYHAIGVNGASTDSYLTSEYFEKELAIINPDLVIFGIGINDAANKDFSSRLFHDNYTQLVKIIENINPDCAFVFVTNNDSFKKISRKKYRVNPNGAVAQKVFYDLAEENQAAVWDLFGLMGGLSSMAKWERAELAQRDKIHFKKAGYELLGDLLYNALIKLYYEIETQNQ